MHHGLRFNQAALANNHGFGVADLIHAHRAALNRHDGPVALLLTRQGLPNLKRVPGAVARGGYIRRDGEHVTLIATGSEVSSALAAADLLDADGIGARVVSLPCWELFFAQDEEYQQKVLGTASRVSVEAGSTFGWERIIGDDGLAIGLDRFGASAPDTVLAEQFGFTPESIATQTKQHLNH